MKASYGQAIDSMINVYADQFPKEKIHVHFDKTIYNKEETIWYKIYILDKIVKKYKTIFKIKYKLKDWISLKKLNWEMLSENPNAIDLLKANPKKIVWWRLSSNPSAIELLREKIEDDKDIDDDDQIIDTNPFNKIDWKWLSANRSDGAIELLKENQTKINWTWLSKNPHPYAIKLLKANPYNIDWDLLSGNPNPEAIELLKDNLTKINWNRLSENPAIFDEILE